MKLIDKNVSLDRIFLDPYNPRFSNQNNLSQEVLLNNIFKTRDAKELLASMASNIKWVNKIVVVDKLDFTEQQKNIINIGNADFLAVEGNTRLACLKSGKIPSITNTTLIPVLVATKDPDESTQEFESQIRITQGIANVMVVKEWGVVSKARHLHLLYKDFISKPGNNNLKPHDIYKKISTELGLPITDVRGAVIRYEFYKTIAEVADSIPEDHWGYLEAFDNTKELRSIFGMSAESNSFKLDEDGDGIIEEILKEIPITIKKASAEGVNTKQFRSIIDKIFVKTSDFESTYETINNITKDGSDFSFKSKLEENESTSEKDLWESKFQRLLSTLESFPTMASWASDYKGHLEKLKTLVEKHLAAFK